jgi:hypothetical protein
MFWKTPEQIRIQINKKVTAVVLDIAYHRFLKTVSMKTDLMTEVNLPF